MKALKIGFSQKDITPPKGIELCGYGYYLARRNTQTLDRLYVRSVAFLQGERPYLLINCDLEGVDCTYYDLIKSEISKKTAISPDDMMLVCIHTHSGPAFAHTLTGCGEPNLDYIEKASRVIVSSACEAFANLREVESIKIAHDVVNDFGFDRTRSGIEVNNRFYALTFSFASGRPLALLNYGCHPVAAGRNTEVTADYPGAVLRELDDADIDGVYLTAFCGDVDPTERGDYEKIEKGRKIGKIYLNTLENAEELEDWTIKSASFDESIRLRILSEREVAKLKGEYLNAANNSPEFQKITSIWSETNRERREGKLPATDLVHVRFLTIGNVLLAGFSAEMTTELGEVVAMLFSDYHVMTLGNLFDTRRYIASAGLVERAAYEGMSHTMAYNTTPIRKGEGERLVMSACNRAKQEMR